jgi:hypothetical protein
MSRENTRLDELENLLARAGDNPLRLELVRRAQRFKRSWVELAEALHTLSRNGDYRHWGFSDLHDYCQKELAIKSATVDKLMLSYGTLERHAPEVLARDGVARALPSQEAVHYFARAVDTYEAQDDEGNRRLDLSDSLVADLRKAVFDDGQSMPELRKTFDPMLRPKSPETRHAEALRTVRAAARRLLQAMQEVEGLSEKRVARVQAAVDALVRDLDGMDTSEGAATEAELA